MSLKWQYLKSLLTPSEADKLVSVLSAKPPYLYLEFSYATKFSDCLPHIHGNISTFSAVQSKKKTKPKNSYRINVCPGAGLSQCLVVHQISLSSCLIALNSVKKNKEKKKQQTLTCTRM